MTSADLRKVAIFVVAGVGLGVVAYMRSERGGRWVEGYYVGTASDVKAQIRANPGPPTVCLSGPPSKEERAEWARLRQENWKRDATLYAKSAAELAALDDATLQDHLLDRVMDKAFIAGMAALTEAERDVYLQFQVDGEVNNGGFDQFFFNSSGDCSLQALEALQRIGLKDDADLLREALSAFPGGRPAENRATRIEQMERIDDDKLSSLDSRYYKLGDRGAKLVRYVRSHLATMSLPARRP